MLKVMVLLALAAAAAAVELMVFNDESDYPCVSIHGEHLTVNGWYSDIYGGWQVSDPARDVFVLHLPVLAGVQWTAQPCAQALANVTHCYVLHGEAAAPSELPEL